MFRLNSQQMRNLMWRVPRRATGTEVAPGPLPPPPGQSEPPGRQLAASTSLPKPSWQELCLHPRSPNLPQHNRPPEVKRSTGSPHASFSETPRSHCEAHHPPGSHEAQDGRNPLAFPSALPRVGSLGVVASQAPKGAGVQTG